MAEGGTWQFSEPRYHRMLTQPSSTGQDATEAFEDVGHSDEARALLPGMLVGDFEDGVRRSPMPLFHSVDRRPYRTSN